MDFSPLVNYIETFFRGEKNIPGCDIQIMREHEILFRHTSGFVDEAHSRPVTADSLYYIYSCTKPLCCVSFLRLVEEGLLGLDEPVMNYLPEYADAYVLRDGEKVTVGHTMTVRHLFTMSSGLGYNHITTDPVRALLKANPMANTREIVAAFARAPLNFAPGESYRYSVSHDVLAAIAEVITGQRFGDFLRDTVLLPLGMKDTTFRPSDEDRKRLLTQYVIHADSSLTEVKNVNFVGIGKNYESAGSGLVSSVDDYSLFADAMANGGVGRNGNRILKEETIDLMRTEQLSAILPNPDIFTCWTGPGYGYGLGVRTMVDNSGAHPSPLGEFGWDGATGTFTLMDPTNKLSIFYAMHVRGWTRHFPDCHIPIRNLTYQCLDL